MNPYSQNFGQPSNYVFFAKKTGATTYELYFNVTFVSAGDDATLLSLLETYFINSHFDVIADGQPVVVSIAAIYETIKMLSVGGVYTFEFDKSILRANQIADEPGLTATPFYFSEITADEVIFEGVVPANNVYLTINNKTLNDALAATNYAKNSFIESVVELLVDFPAPATFDLTDGLGFKFESFTIERWSFDERLSVPFGNASEFSISGYTLAEPDASIFENSYYFEQISFTTTNAETPINNMDVFIKVSTVINGVTYIAFGDTNLADTVTVRRCAANKAFLDAVLDLGKQMDNAGEVTFDDTIFVDLTVLYV